ncbi:hypothetical protein A3K73_07090 [Candidatus Pacearchaeota archaeon RBG_13_36_9]|nr:MAG: hypothetical protein A3K73_07090 [Candidatus Pacearchaeota archaeon RBG_13_36_9]
MRRYATVEERVRQVKQTGVPYWSFYGVPEAEMCNEEGEMCNDIRTDGFLHLSEECLTVTPEASISSYDVNKGRIKISIAKLDEGFIPALNRAAGKRFSKEKYTSGLGRISALALRVHFIYDSVSDITHCFALPDIEMLSKK